MDKRLIVKSAIITALIAFVIAVISIITVLNIRQNDREAKAAAINECFQVSEYSTLGGSYETKEPIERYFQLCMKFNGYNPDEFAFNQ